jgi:ribose/xylose/arabinose/galactoside ABC-type transport system permease subunit
MRTAFIAAFILQVFFACVAAFNHDSNWQEFIIMAIIVAFFTPEKENKK